MSTRPPIRGAVDARRVLEGHGFAVDVAGPNRWRVMTDEKGVVMNKDRLLRMAEAIRAGWKVDRWGNPVARAAAGAEAH